MNHMALVRLASSVLLVATIQGCNSPPINVNNSPCATVNGIVQSKSYVDLSLLFGADAIKAALDFIKSSFGKLGSASTAEIVSGGTDAAVRTAEARGREVKPEDRAKLETYLRDEAVPAIRQNPTCNINYASPPRSYVGVERISLVPGQNPQISIKNSGQAEAQAHVSIRQFVNGSEHSKGRSEIALLPGQLRSINLLNPVAPIDEVLVGKSTLVIAISISYIPEPNGKKIHFNEMWHYDHRARTFFIVPMK
jgi:hypothetical protein